MPKGCSNKTGATKAAKKKPTAPVKKKEEPCPFKVVEIKAKVPGTEGVRDKTKKKAENVLKSSNKDKESLKDNAPVILVRGCKDVELEAVTDPAGKPVKWEVKPNENKSVIPSITTKDGGKKAVLKTNKPGAFSVIAKLNKTKVVWNVVFVWVKVYPKTTVVNKRSKLYADSGSNATWTCFRSGEFVKKKYAWGALCKTVKLIGGGKDKDIGINKVELHILQNGSGDSLTGHYQDGGTCLEQPKGGLPVVDATGSGSPFIVSPSCFKVKPSNTVAKRSIWTADSPAGAFQKEHKNSAGKLIQSITGSNDFITAIASTSKEAPNAIVVHAKVKWSANYKGKVDYGKTPGAIGKYKRDGAKTTSGKRYIMISTKNGGMDAGEAGFETFEPRFNGGTDEVWNP